MIGVARRSHLEDAAAMTFRRSKSTFRLPPRARRPSSRGGSGRVPARGPSAHGQASARRSGSCCSTRSPSCWRSSCRRSWRRWPLPGGFRASNAKAERLPTWAYSGRIELVTWSVPLLTIMFLGGIAWIGSHDLDPARPLSSDKKAAERAGRLAGLEVAVSSTPTSTSPAVNQLVVPVNTPIPLHPHLGKRVGLSFFVPGLGSMIYTMNGMTTQLNLLADRTGDFPGLSTHLSGDGFSDMNFMVHAVPADAFDGWLKTQRSGPKLDQAAYRELAKQSSAVPPMTYSATEPGLFEAVVAQKLPPGPGPTGGTATVSPKGGS